MSCLPTKELIRFLIATYTAFKTIMFCSFKIAFRPLIKTNLPFLCYTHRSAITNPTFYSSCVTHYDLKKLFMS